MVCPEQAVPWHRGRTTPGFSSASVSPNFCLPQTHGACHRWERSSVQSCQHSAGQLHPGPDTGHVHPLKAVDDHQGLKRTVVPLACRALHALICLDLEPARTL